MAGSGDTSLQRLFPGASIGELSNLNTGELERATTIVADQADGAVPVYAGVGASGTLEAVERTKRAAAAGASRRPVPVRALAGVRRPENYCLRT